MKIKIIFMAILVPAILFGGILASIAADAWSTTSDKKPATYLNGSYAGEYNPADIRGSYTFAEISELFEIDLDILYKAFNIPEGTDGTSVKSKDLETLSDTGVGNESIQVFVALYKGLPIETGSAILPEEAVKMILESGNPTQEQQQYLKEYTPETVSQSESEAAASSAQPEKSDGTGTGTGSAGAGTETGTEEEQLVNGSATFQQVLDAGITKEQIESIIGNEMPPANQTVKDYCNSMGLSFSDIKEQLNGLVE